MVKTQEKKDTKDQHIISLAGTLVIAAFVFFWAAGLAAQHSLRPAETRIFYTIYNWPAFWHPLFFVATQFGSVWMLFLISGIWLIKHRERFALVLLANGAIAYLLVTIAKQVVQRGRPDVLLQGVQAYDKFASGYGFPSGHTAVSTVVALTLWQKLPRNYHFIIPTWIVLVALSRVDLGVHAPLDIVGGFAIGVAVFCAYRLSLKFLPKKLISRLET